MNIEQAFNFNDPVEITEIFRDRVQTEGGILVKEYGFKSAFGWEDIRGISEYCYKEDWEQYKGPKYYLKLGGNTSNTLVLGDYHSMLAHWTSFRNKYPMFRDEPKEEDGND